MHAFRRASSADGGPRASRCRSTAWTRRFFVDEGDLAAARDLVGQVEDADLFLYPGDQHLFADSSLSSYDAHATSLLVERVTAFLDRTTRT